MSLAWSWLGRLPYAEAIDRQRTHRKAVIDGTAPEVLWLLEHDPVITTGKRPVLDLPSAQVLNERGIALHHTERGGLATWHGPGQLVAYVIIDAATRGLGVRGTVCALEQSVIDWLAASEIQATRRPKAPGIWVNDNKICALGLHFRKGVSMHGLALNLCPDLSDFSLFTPCGINDGGVTSVAEITGHSPTPEQAAPSLAARLITALSPTS